MTLCHTLLMQSNQQIHTYIHKGQLKSSQTDQDTPMKCDQMRFIFQHSPHCGLYSFSIGVAVLGYHWSNSHQQQIWHHHINFSAPTLIYIYIYIYIYSMSLGNRFSCRHILLKMTDKDLVLSFFYWLFMLVNAMSQL